MDVIFTFLYPIVGLVSIIAYIPQLKSLIFAKTICKDMSLTSWLLWSGTSIITAGYASFAVKDLMFAATSIVGCFFVLAVSGLIIYNRYFRFREEVTVQYQAAE